MAGHKLNVVKAERAVTKPAAPKPKQADDQTKPAKAVEPAAEKPRTIRSICEEGLLAGLAYDQIIANVKLAHPDAETTPGCISWYRSKMEKKGLVPSGKEMAAARKRAAEAEAEAAHTGEA